MKSFARVLSMVAVGVPLALAAAGGPPPPAPVDAAALSSPNYSVEQRVAMARARQALAHPLWQDLPASARVQRLMMFGQRMVRAAAAAAADGPAATPAQFQGNLSLVKVASGKAIELQRQADCSLSYSEGSYALSLISPSIQVLSTTAQYQTRLRAAAGLGAQAGAFPRGCAEATLGIGSRRGFYLGRTSQNLYLFASSGYNYTSGSNALYYGAIDAATQTVQAFHTDTSLPSIEGITAGDLNGDGLADVVGLDRSSGAVSVWLAHADGTLGAPSVVATAGTSTRAAVLADFDGDGKVDLVAATSVPNGNTKQELIAFLRGRGDGSFEAARILNLTTPRSASSALLVNLVAVDLRGTGRLDIVGSNGLVLLNNGSGGFTQAGWAFPPPWSTTSWGPTLAVGDFNADGKLDVAVNNGVSVQIHLGRGDGGFDTGRAYASSDSVGYLTATDLDGDGHTDLWIGLANGGFFGGDQFGVNQGYALMGRGDGSFAGAPALPFVYNGHNLVDLNGDRQLDGIGVNSDRSFTTYLGDGRGGFTARATLVTSPLVLGGGTFALNDIDSYDLADIDADGKLDLVFLSRDFVARNSTVEFNSPGFLIARGDGQGGFARPTFVPAPSFVPVGDFEAHLTLSNLRLADVNGDGKADLVYAYGSTAYNTNQRSIGTAVQLGNRDGTFQPPRLLPFYTRTDANFSVDLTSTVQHIVDLNGDGKPDLLLVTQTPTRDSTLSGNLSDVQVALGAGDGSFAAPVTVSGPQIVARYYGQSQPTPIVVADMNGDGIADLVVLGSSGDYNLQVAIALGKGDGSFKPPNRTTFGAQALGGEQQLAVADFNGDGKPDVLLANPFGGSGIAFGGGDGTLVPLGTATFASFNLLLNLPLGGPTRVLELNGDGKPDVLVGNTLLISMATAASTPGTFALDANSLAGSVQAGQTAQTTLTVAPGNGYTGTISFACAGLPTGASCSFSPVTLTVSSGSSTAQSTTLMIGTTATASAGLFGHSPIDPRLPCAFLLAAFATAAMWRRPAGCNLITRRARLLTVLAVGGVALAACGGSGGGSPGSNATPPGSYIVNVTASDGSISRNFNYTLQVN